MGSGIIGIGIIPTVGPLWRGSTQGCTEVTSVSIFQLIRFESLLGKNQLGLIHDASLQV